MSLRGEFCRVLDKYKSGAWDRDKAAAQLEKYFNEHVAAAEIKGKLDEADFWRDRLLDGKSLSLTSFTKRIMRLDGHLSSLAKLSGEQKK